jgi:arabinose-5-phosphate isomerase
MNCIETGKHVLETEANAITKAISRIDETFAEAINILHQCRGQVLVTGMGKSGLVGRKIAATFTSTGTPAVFLHPAEAIHGDMGIIHGEDVIIALSTSGETEEVLRLLVHIKRLGSRLISLVGHPRSTLARRADVFLDCGVEKEACPIGLVPTASSTLALAMGDALAIALMIRKGFGEEDFRFFHPGGMIGKKLLKVKHLMHTGAQLPIVHADTPMPDVLRVMNEKRFGVALVVDGQNRTQGIITDGDLRRLLIRGVDLTAERAQACMSANPQHIGEESLAVEALRILEEKSITSIVVDGRNQELRGLLHLHDLWRTEMI